MLTLIFLIAFPFALWKAWRNIQLAKASTDWPTVIGMVTSSDAAKVMFRKQPRVTYSYSVDGALFIGNRISFAGGYPPRETDAILSRYPTGKEIPVSYAPDKPAAEATLETGSNRQVTVQLRILLIFFVLIVLLNILNFYLKRLNESRKPLIRTYGAAEIVDSKWRG